MDRFTKELEAIYPKLMGFATLLTNNVIRAEDLRQETMLLALKCREQFQLGTNLKSWVFTIMRNAYISQVRKEGRMLYFGSLRDLPQNKGYEGNQLVALELADVFARMDALPEIYREAMNLHLEGYLEGTGYEEMAERLGIPVGTLKNRVFRARKALAACEPPDADG